MIPSVHCSALGEIEVVHPAKERHVKPTQHTMYLYIENGVNEAQLTILRNLAASIGGIEKQPDSVSLSEKKGTNLRVRLVPDLSEVAIKQIEHDYPRRVVGHFNRTEEQDRLDRKRDRARRAETAMAVHSEGDRDYGPWS